MSLVFTAHPFYYKESMLEKPLPQLTAEMANKGLSQHITGLEKNLLFDIKHSETQIMLSLKI